LKQSLTLLTKLGIKQFYAQGNIGHYGLTDHQSQILEDKPQLPFPFQKQNNIWAAWILI